ncbi:hypothetical protein [Haloarcula argentinensis]|uniref:Uncharacterized protein n=1 Tax=Haloarcula argentinensis TaxID=43776 RepID=A0A830FT90_HALAR|nr:hypothetical protein [Haloarcula argentinensis]EMA20698.1 hypothetical protein C443_12321 [Haloarcula argentinensis DSM 12282]MDS0255100.1 hypothetical protein [Haloarcula argentinensis]GGM36566.1 hypothetical protein GCM10009006_17180 [Haloarcula argentinensis]
MDRRGIAEIGGLSLAGGVLAIAVQQVLVGGIDWVLVVGLVACVGIAAAANYQARTKHAAQVATEAPAVTEDNYEQHGRPTAGDGGVPPDDTRSGDDDR